MNKRASHYTYLKMCEHVYRGDSLQKDDPVPKATDWIVKEKHSGPSGFFAVVYEHSKEKRRIVAFRGTDSAGAVWEDVAGVVFNGNSPQKEAAFKVVDDVVKKAKEEGCAVSFTGHSLGAFLASLAVFYSNRFLDYPDAYAVTFENPGPYEAIKKLTTNIPHGSFDEAVSKLDIISYQSYPNRINTFGRQVGSVYTIDANLGSWGNLPGVFLKNAHGTRDIVAFFDANATNPNLPLLVDWPLGNQRDIFFKESRFVNGVYQIKTPNEATIKAKEKGCKLVLQKQEFNMAVAGHFQKTIKYNNQTSIALRHFSRQAQKFLQLFYEKLCDTAKKTEQLELLKERWNSLELKKEVIACLIGYRIEEDMFHPKMVLLDNSLINIFFFYNAIEEWLSDKQNQKSIAELFSFADQDSYSNELVTKDNLPEVWNVPQNNGYYVPINEVQLVEKFGKNVSSTNTQKNNMVSLVAMVGLAGVGKTEFAKNYINSTFANKKYTSRIWFRADTREELEGEYRLLAEYLQINRKSDAMHLVKNSLNTFLAEHPGWLLVVDNADVMEAINPMLPSYGGDILITSRDPRWNGTVIEMNILFTNEGVRFYKEFIKKLKNKNTSESHHNDSTDENDIVKLIVAMEGLTLAIAQAASYINEAVIEPAKYLELFNENREIILKTNTLILPSENKVNRLTVATTWNLSLNIIEKRYTEKNSPFLAKKLLMICSFLDTKNIPRDFLKKCIAIYSRSPEVDLNEAIIQLKNHTLIMVDTKFVHLHLMVHESIRLFYNESIILVDDLVRLMLPELNSVDLDYNKHSKIRILISHAEKLAMYSEEHIKDKNELQKLCSQIGMYHEHIGGNFASAIQWHSKSLEIFLKKIDDIINGYKADGKIIKSEEVLPLTEGATKNYTTDAYDLLSAYGKIKYLTKYHKTLHLEWIDLLIKIGDANFAAGEYRKAEDYQRAVNSCIDQFPALEKSSETIILSKLAKTSFAMGELIQAKVLHERALSINAKHGLLKPLDKADIYGNLGLLYIVLGDSEKGKNFQIKCLNIITPYYGDTHPKVMEKRCELACTHVVIGNYLEAEKTLKNNFENCQRLYEKTGHPVLARALSTMGLIKALAGNSKEALEYHLQAYEMFKTCLGETHESTILVMNDVGWGYYTLNNYSLAIEQALKTINLFNQFDVEYQKKSHFLLYSYILCAHTSIAMGHIADAISYLENAKKISSEHYKDCVPSYTNFFSHVTLEWKKIFSEREFSFKLENEDYILSSIQKLYGTDHPELAYISILFGQIYFKTENYNKALLYYQKAKTVFDAYTNHRPNDKNNQKFIEECIENCKRQLDIVQKHSMPLVKSTYREAYEDRQTTTHRVFILTSPRPAVLEQQAEHETPQKFSDSQSCFHSLYRKISRKNTIHPTKENPEKSHSRCIIL